MSYEPQQPRPDYRPGGNSGYIPPRNPQDPQYAGGDRGPGGPVPPRGTTSVAGAGGPGGSSGPRDEERTVAILTHLSAPVAAVLSVGWVPFLGPLIVWFIYKDKSPFLRSAAAGSFNFNVTLALLNVVGWICIFTVILIPVGLILLGLFWVLLLVCHIMAAVRANKGLPYRYPMQLPILH